MPAPKRNPIQKARDNRIVYSLYIQGFAQAVIAQKLQEATGESYQLSQQQISNDIQLVKKQIQERPDFDVDVEKNKRLTEIDSLEWTYWDAWRRSLEPIEKRTEMRRSPSSQNGRNLDAPSNGRNLPESPIDIYSQSLETREIYGDPRFLKGIEWCISERCRILGLYAPPTANINVRGNIKHEHEVTITETQRLEILAELAAPPGESNGRAALGPGANGKSSLGAASEEPPAD